MKTTNKLFYLALPLVLLGCQTLSPGRLPASTGSVANQSASMTLAGSPTKAAEVPPTTDVTLTAPEARGAVISTQPVAEVEQPANFGGLVLSVRWPEAARKTLAIPTTANSLWIKVYSGSLGKASATAAPDGTVVASRVIGRDANDQVPGATPTPCCGPQDSAKRSTVYLSLPAGAVTVWVGTFAETPAMVSTSSVYLSSGQDQYTIVANQLGSTKSLTLGPNAAVAPAITGVSPQYAGPGATVTLAGANLGGDPEIKAALFKYPDGCPSCQPTVYDLTGIAVTSATTATASIPTTANSGIYQIQLVAKGFTVLGGTVGVLDKNQGLSFGLDPNATRQSWNNTTQQYDYATARGAKITVSSLTGRICCNNEVYNLPLSSITVKTPGGDSLSLDAGGSFTTDQAGLYTLSANSGDVKGAYKLNSYNLRIALDTSKDCENCGSSDYFAYPVASLVQPDDPTSGNYYFPTKLFYFVKSAVFVDAQDNELTNIQGFSSADFTYQGDNGLILGSNRTITGGNAGTSTLTAALKIAPTQTATAGVNVLGPTSVKLYNVPGSVCRNCGGYDLYAKLVYSLAVVPAKPEAGKDDDFDWSTSDSSLVTVDPQGMVSIPANAGAGTATITATLKNNQTFKATASITVPAN